MKRTSLVVATAVAMNLVTATAAGAAPPPPACTTPGPVLSVEEQRTVLPLPGQTVPAARQFIEAAGFEGIVDGFAEQLCTHADLAAATTAIRAAGVGLWEAATARAQGRSDPGTIDRYDDRPLYWARTTMNRALREWQPTFDMSNLQRQAIARQFTYASRGIDDVAFPDDHLALLISGFDTFSLDASLRNSNPSGASALQLDGRTVETPEGTATIQAVLLPVNWTDFDQGIVEDAFGPWLVPEDHPAHRGSLDLLMTISQTSRGRMDIEKWAGAFRGGSPDNNRSLNWGPISASPRWPQPQPSPQFIETTLPFQEMIDAGTGPWPVALHAGITEWPAGTFPDPTALRSAPDPSPGSRAASAPGGNYLSNESMYRTNRLRLATGNENLPGGHLHISALEYTDPAASGTAPLSHLTDPAFEADRRAIVDQTVALVDAAAGALRP